MELVGIGRWLGEAARLLGWAFGSTGGNAGGRVAAVEAFGRRSGFDCSLWVELVGVGRWLAGAAGLLGWAPGSAFGSTGGNAGGRVVAVAAFGRRNGFDRSRREECGLSPWGEEMGLIPQGRRIATGSPSLLLGVEAQLSQGWRSPWMGRPRRAAVFDSKIKRSARADRLLRRAYDARLVGAGLKVRMTSVGRKRRNKSESAVTMSGGSLEWWEVCGGTGVGLALGGWGCMRGRGARLGRSPDCRWDFGVAARQFNGTVQVPLSGYG
jgi:hypothetical protein